MYLINLHRIGTGLNPETEIADLGEVGDFGYALLMSLSALRTIAGVGINPEGFVVIIARDRITWKVTADGTGGIHVDSN